MKTKTVAHTMAAIAERATAVGTHIEQASRERLRQAGEAIDRRAIAMVEADTLNRTLDKLIGKLYDGAGVNDFNVDRVTGRILLTMPTSQAAYKRWGLTKGEAFTLRWYLLNLQAKYRAGGRVMPPLLTFNYSNYRWYLSVASYPTAEAGHAWLERHRFTADSWLVAYNAYYAQHYPQQG